MTEQELVTLLEEEYMAKILGFSYQKLQNRAEAEELASDIALEVLKVIRSGKEIGNFNAFVWSVSNHIFFNHLRKKKYGSVTSLTELLAAADNVEEELIKKEQENLLRREIAMLGEKYRRAVVLFYFEGKSCEEIGEILAQSTGTIKWWLHEARTSIKEGMEIMREYGEKSFNPGELFMSCQGNPGLNMEPISCAKRKLAQNILLAAYEEPVTIRELCAEHGVAAAYMEDEVAALVDNQLMKEVSRGKFQTDFVILPWNIEELQKKLYESCFPGYYEKLLAFLEEHKDQLTDKKCNRDGFTWERLLWVYIPLFTETVLNTFRAECCNFVNPVNMQRPNGGQWIAIGYKGGSPEKQMQGKDIPEYCFFDGPVNKPGVLVQGFFHHWSGTDSTVFFDLPAEGIKNCGKILNNRAVEEDKYCEMIAEAMKWKLLSKHGEAITPNYYRITEEALLQIFPFVQSFYETAKPYFETAWKLILKEFEPAVPKHLHGQMGNFLSRILSTFVTCALYEGEKQGVLSGMEVEGKEWISLVVFEE